MITDDHQNPSMRSTWCSAFNRSADWASPTASLPCKKKKLKGKQTMLYFIFTQHYSRILQRLGKLRFHRILLLQVDLLTDIAHSPRILTNFASAIQPASFKKVKSLQWRFYWQTLWLEKIPIFCGNNINEMPRLFDFHLHGPTVGICPRICNTGSKS